MNRHVELLDIVDAYFRAIYEGNVLLLRGTFHPKAVLIGEVKGQPYLKSLNEYLESVERRKSPSELGEEFAMKAISIEVLGDIAFAKVQLKMLGYNYFDFLSFVRHQDRWTIVSKVFTHLA